MHRRLARREFLTGAAAGAAVVAFDPLARSWVTAAEAAVPAAGPLLPEPALDGELVTDPADLAAAADDFGHLVHRRPLAVLRPGSARDVVELVRYARRHRLPGAMRGQGHATNGQAQVGDGVLIDSRTLARVHHVGNGVAVADTGVTWLDLARLPRSVGRGHAVRRRDRRRDRSARPAGR